MLFHISLTILFLFFIIYHFLFFNYYYKVDSMDIIEGLDNKTNTSSPSPSPSPSSNDLQYIEPPGQSDPLYISRINSSNISYLKSQIDGIQQIKQQILETNSNVKKNTEDIAELQTGLKQLGSSMSQGLNSKTEEATGINPASKKELPAVV